MTIIVPLKPISWNVLARKNHWKYTAVSTEWKQYTKMAVEMAKIKPIQSFPCKIFFHAKWKDKRRHDIDSLFCKSVMDTLTAKTETNPFGTGIIPDDSIAFVSSVTYTGETGAGRDELILTITPHETRQTESRAVYGDDESIGDGLADTKKRGKKDRAVRPRTP